MGWTEEHTEEKQNWIHRAVKKTKIPLIYWATEDPLHTTNFSYPLIKRMKPDFVFTVTSNKCDFYKSKGIKAAHLDFAYHKRVHHKVKTIDKYRTNIAVVANAYPKFLRRQSESFRLKSLKTLIAPLLRKNIRIDFWGKDWEHMEKFLGKKIPRNWIHGYLNYTEANKVYNSAKIVIGLQNCTDQLTQRTYEVMGSGGLLLTSDTPEVRSKFRSSQDLLVSSSPRKTVKIVKNYLNKHKEREQIRTNGIKSVKRDTYLHRAKKIIKVLRENGLLNNISNHTRPGKVIHYMDFIRSKYRVHTVAPGDTLWQISRKYKVSLRRIQKLNPLISDRIYPGDIIKIRKKRN
jgi:spore maturation protein CgeB